jgi:hypothetical protein
VPRRSHGNRNIAPLSLARSARPNRAGGDKQTKSNVPAWHAYAVGDSEVGASIEHQDPEGEGRICDVVEIVSEMVNGASVITLSRGINSRSTLKV